MKKINSIWFGATILKWVGVFLILIPTVFFIFAKLSNSMKLLYSIIYTSIVLGIVILIFFIVILGIELRQDKKIDYYFQRNKNSKISLQNGQCECQNCGNSKVKVYERNCTICGATFMNVMGGKFKMDFQTTQCIDFKQGSVEESLFIPLIVKEKESKRNDFIFNDLKSIEIMKTLKIETSRLDGGNIAYHGILVRTTILDKVTKEFIKKSTNGTIINLGAGLDTRIERVDNDNINWFDVDLPEVIKLRRKFFSESARIRFISKSILDTSWVDEIDTERNGPILIIAEGLLMYFTEQELKEIFELLIKKFPNAEMCFDVVHKFFVGKGVSSKFKWGIGKNEEIKELNTKIELIKHWSVGDYYKRRQELLFRILNIFPSTRNRSQIFHIKLNS